MGARRSTRVILPFNSFGVHGIGYSAPQGATGHEACPAACRRRMVRIIWTMNSLTNQVSLRVDQRFTVPDLILAP